MKTLLSRISILMIFSILFSTITYGQNLKKPGRPSFKVNSDFKRSTVTTTNEQKVNGSRSFYLTNKFYSPQNKNVIMDDIDTLNYPLEGTYSIYSADAGGYVTGNNGYGDLAKANKFVIPQACQLTGILFDFYKATGGPADIEIVVWDNSGENNVPGEIIGIITVPISSIQNDISNNQMSYVAFDEPIIITTTFYAGMILPTSAGDTLVVWSNTDGDTDPGIAWDQWSDSTWHAMFLSSSWGLNLAQAIFPIVDYGNLPLMADFMASTTHIQPGESVTFTDLSTGNPTSREWTFEGGDPATSNEPSLVVVYNEEGTYDVTLTVEKDTIQDTKSVADYITVATTSIEVDTLNYPLEGTYAVYITEGNGFVSGNNEFGDLAKANYYNVNENLFITGILYEFAYGTGGGSTIEFSIWNNSGSNNSPGSKIAFKTLPLDDILDDVEAQDFTYVEFNPPVLVDGPFYAGLMLPATTGDTLVVWSNMHNDTDPGIAWELWNTNEWYPFSTSWLQDVALAIYPIVQNTLDVNENTVFDGLYIYPNPSDGQYTIDLAKHSHQALQLKVFNTSGNCIADQSFEKREVSISFDISGFPAGVYMVRLTDSQHTYLQKIIKN
jgi:PKD repeat protein